jgi:hypothetical protein
MKLIGIHKLLKSLQDGADAGDAAQAFFEDFSSLETDAFPLDNFCKIGGSPDEDGAPEIAIIEADFLAASSKLTGSFTAYFDEKVYGGGCPDMPTIKSRQGDISFDIDLLSGKIEYGCV